MMLGDFKSGTLETMVLVIALLFLLHTADSFIFNTKCPVEQPCRCYGSTVNCVRVGLRSFPSFNFEYADVREFEIDMRKNSITSVPANAFGNIVLMEIDELTINLSENKIQTIDENAFKPLTHGVNSIELVLTDNNLTSLPHALGKLTNLRTLRILDNRILYLDDHVMSVIGPSLQTLWLDAGSLAIWPRSMSHLVELTELQLDKIQFHSLPDSAFDGMSKLTRLEITNSKLQSVPNAFCHLPQVQLFKFQHNYNIPNFASRVFPNCSQMPSVLSTTLSYNNLYFFPKEVFALFPNLKTLGLDYNKITDIPYDAIPENSPLYYLYMQGNLLTRIPPAISKLHGLLTLILSENNITTVDGSTLSGIQTLRQLTLINVPIKYIDPHAFSTNYTMINLHLDNTDLTSVPAAVMHCADRFHVRLTGSPITCTCDNLAFLRGFPLSDFETGLKNFYGDCVNTGGRIQDFVIEMKTNC